MPKVLVSLLAISTLSMFLPGELVAQSQINVFVTAGEGGFAGPGAGDSAQDLIASLKKKRRIAVVTTKSDADVIIQVNSRNTVQKTTGATTTTRVNKDKDKATQVTTDNNMTMRQVHAVLQAGSYKTDLEGESITWKGAADGIAGHVDKWVEENYARLIETRLENRYAPAGAGAAAPAAPAEAAAPAAQPDTSASIKPGMSPEQVKSSLGEPHRKVTFGTREMWTYQGIEVVFEDGKVTDVKF